MLSFISSLLSRLSGGASAPAAPAFDAVEYKGYRLRPDPYPGKGGFQTAGIIEKEIAGETKQHRFVRAETHPSQDDAANFALVKARQIVDEQGDRIFDGG
ncbi:HlyU family transcriptional regulator [Salinarimonas soli]|uniref:Uncharacterized protein n=1 Tax=Salinarimonas soli TaxID=1638099 RepID=A0A5B2VS78_9HYPH|nr:HlyU family transcriptional regulator [Salinarimonas soli]KAA2241057.1 hypothetical protein F0L46_05315 [Salinarimonas soli]